MIASILQTFDRPKVTKIVVFTSIAVLIGGIELFDLQNTQSYSYYLTALGLLTVFTLSAWNTVFEFIFITTKILLTVFNLLDQLEMLDIGIFTIVVVWIIRSWFLPALAVLFLNETISFLVSDIPEAQLLSSIINIPIVVSIGLALSWQKGKRILAEASKEKARQANLDIRSELAKQLHDTTAKDIAHIAIMLQDFTQQHPEYSGQMRPIIDTAFTASRRIRPMILSLDTEAKELSTSQVVHQVEQMLTTRKIALEASIDSEIDNSLDSKLSKKINLVLRECGTNILKYAPPSSNASVEIYINHAKEQVTVSIINQVAPGSHFTEITGGYGLLNLKQRLESEGDSLEFTQLDERWIINVTLQINPRPLTHEQENLDAH